MPKRNSPFWVIIAISLPALFFLFNPAKFPADDGFFYPQIAAHIVNGNGVRFNTLYLTNGFHPLWMLFCTLGALLNFGSKVDVLPILWILQCLFVLVSFRILSATFFKNQIWQMGIALGSLSLMFFSLGTLYLTEAHLSLLCMVVLLRFLYLRRKHDYEFGILAGLMCLARLDNVFLLFFLGFYYWHLRNWNGKTLLKMCIAYLVIIGPYLLINTTYFGSIVPISGMIKSSFPEIQEHISISIFQKLFVMIGIIYLAILSYFSISNARLKGVFTLGALFLLVYNLVFQSAIGQWYFVSQMLFTSLFIYDFLKLLQEKFQYSPQWEKLVFMFIFIGIMGFGFTKLMTNFSVVNHLYKQKVPLVWEPKDPLQESVQDLSQKLSSNSRIFVDDYPGKFAFYSNFDVIPADGLINNKSYFESIDSLKMKKYWLLNDFDYVILPYDLNRRNKAIKMMAVRTEGFGNELSYLFTNTLSKKVIDTLYPKDFYKFKTYPNPTKTYQPDFNSIAVYSIQKP